MNQPRDVPTVASLIAAWAQEIDSLLPDLSAGTLENWTMSSSRRGAFFTETPYRWSSLSAPAAQTQSRALEEYRRLYDHLRVLLREQPSERLAELEEDTARVTDFIERRQSPFPSPTAALENAREALARQVRQIENLFSDNDEGVLFITDTNALYWNTALEDWRSPWPGLFSVVLTPAVVIEIDRHKNDDRNKSRQEKAERVDRQIGEYRRRGRLVDGVVLVRGVSTILAIAAEPRMAESLRWLDATSADDRLVAVAIEVMRRNVQSRVIVVTRDQNLQNKLEPARVPFIPPSDLVAKA